MKFEDFFREAKSRIVIIGTNPLMPHLERGAKFLADMLTMNKDIRVTILVESDSECFNQSLCVDTVTSKNRHSFTSLMVHRDRVIGKTKRDGLISAVSKELQRQESPLRSSVLSRLTVKQSNLRLPVNIIVADGSIWTSVTTHSMPTLNSYVEVLPKSQQYEDILEFVEFHIREDGGAKFLSSPDQELIQMYDRTGIPRGIYPRDCFYSTEYERYSIWGFVFNRKGQIILHKRSPYPKTKDGADLWDKSVGGHVDLTDSSTSITAERELIEEMFLPEAEYTKYVQADMGDIIHFGEWNTLKRPESTFVEGISGLARDDWVMFRATDDNGQPLTISRVSDRRLTDKKGSISWKRTVFRSDIFLFIAPSKYLDTEVQMKKILGSAEGSGAAVDHKLVSVSDLRNWILEEETKDNAKNVFTDDILFVNLRYRDVLEGFSEFVKFLSVQEA